MTARTTTSLCSPDVVGDNSPIQAPSAKHDWRWVVGRAVTRAGNQSKLATLLGTKEQNVRRWINNDDDPSPTHNDQMKFVDSIYRRDPVQARAFLADVLESLSHGRDQLAHAEHPTAAEVVARMKTDLDKFLTGSFAGGGLR